MAKCAGITQAGTACKGIPIEGSDYCYVHHPDYADERRRHGSRGGKRGGRGRPVAELAALRAENAEIRQRLLGDGDDKLSPGVATAAIQSINTDIRAVIAALKAREQEDLEARIEALEQTQRTERAGKLERSGKGRTAPSRTELEIWSIDANIRELEAEMKARGIDPRECWRGAPVGIPLDEHIAMLEAEKAREEQQHGN